MSSVMQQFDVEVPPIEDLSRSFSREQRRYRRKLSKRTITRRFSVAGIVIAAALTVLILVVGDFKEEAWKYFTAIILGLLLMFGAATAYLRIKHLMVLHNAHICWVKAKTIRAWAKEGGGARLMRNQDIPKADFGDSALLAPRSLCTTRYVVSHPWLSASHPDPNGLRLRELVETLDRLRISDEASLFLDFCSLPQNDKLHPDFSLTEALPKGHPALRTEEENKHFSLALKAMQYLYTSFPVIILSTVPADSQNPTPYSQRGWCFFEMCISFDYNGIINDTNEQTHTLLSTHVPFSPKEFQETFQKKKFTNKGDKQHVLDMYKSLHTFNAGNQVQNMVYIAGTLLMAPLFAIARGFDSSS